MYPFFVYGCFGLYFSICLSLLSFLFLLFSIKGEVKVEINKILLVLLVLVSLMISLLFNTSNVNLNNYFIITMPFFIFFFLSNKEMRVKATDFFQNIFVIFVTISMMLSIMLMMGLGNYIHMFKIYDSQGVFDIYLFTVLREDLTYRYATSLFHRFHAIFFEPGFVGTLSAFFIMANGFNIKDKRNIFLLIAGVMSTSFAFYILMTLYVVLTRPLKGTFVILIIVCSLLIIDNPFFNHYVIDRFMGGAETIDNRNGIYESQQIALFKDVYFNFDIIKIIFSVGHSVPDSTGSYRYILLSNGLLSVLILLICYAICVYSDFKYNFFCCRNMVVTAIFIISLYQRPYIDNFYMLLSFYSLFSKSNRGIA
ncbi:hypothetical protein [Edwardsiella tarda]